MHTVGSLKPLKPSSPFPSADKLFNDFRRNFPVDLGSSGYAPDPFCNSSGMRISKNSRYVEEAHFQQLTRESYWADPGARIDETCPILAELLSFTRDIAIPEPASAYEQNLHPEQRTAFEIPSSPSSFDTSAACPQSIIFNADSHSTKFNPTQPIDFGLQACSTSPAPTHVSNTSSEGPGSTFTSPPSRSESPTTSTETQPYQFGTDDRFTEDGFNVPPPIDSLLSNTLEEHQLAAKWIVFIMQNPMQLDPTIELRQQIEKSMPKNTSPWKQRWRWAPRGQKQESSYADLEPKQQTKTDNLEKKESSHKVDDRRTFNGRKKRGPTSPTPPKPTLRRLERLDPEQKRKNHIKCEQKRRAELKTGFIELNNLVPELRLRGGRVNISNALIQAAMFIELLVSTNIELKRRIRLVGRG